MRPGPLLALICGAGVALGACSDSDKPASSAPSSTAGTPTSTTTATGGRLSVEGNATLDGAPFDARFLGAVVLRDGLATACQAAISSIFTDGYRVDVLPQRESAGCGMPGDRVALWTYARGKKLYSTSTVPWPEPGNRATFDAHFETAKPQGAAPPVTELSGTVTERNGRAAPVGTRVEAYIGDTRCGVASVRRFDENYSGYVLSVVGPDSVAACARGGRISFRIDGRPARQTYVNALAPPASGSGGSFPLTAA
jgi:hypothetical protein